MTSDNGSETNDGVLLTRYRDSIHIELALSLTMQVKNVMLNMIISDKEFNQLATVRSETFTIESTPSQKRFKVVIADVQLSQGNYYISVAVKDGSTYQQLFVHHNIKMFRVTGDFPAKTPFDFYAEWS